MTENSTPPTHLMVERYHWVNTFVGILDSAFHLREEEQYAAARIVGQLLDWLDIPGRGQPAVLPLPLLVEVTKGFYTLGLNSYRQSDLGRPIRAVVDTDQVVPLETWRQSLQRLLTTAYELNAEELLMIDIALNRLLSSLGVPERAPDFLPEDVVRADRDM
jgi:hypothetical protein